MTLAEHGLTLEGPKSELAEWLQAAAARQGNPELALAAGIIGFKDLPNVVAYLDVEQSAGPAWDSVRDALLQYLRAHQEPIDGAIEVFLHEGLIGDAIERVKDRESWDYSLTWRVAEAAVESHPDWAAEVGRRQAESIINDGRADLYNIAVRWLRTVSRAMRSAGQEAAWQDYLTNLTLEHRRKYKLRPMLQDLARRP